MAATVALPLRASAPAGRWLFSRGVDLSVFFGSAALSMVLLGVGAAAGVLDQTAPDWIWVPAVLLVDVAHVYSTGFRVYLDTDELRRRPALYALVPVLGLVAAIALYGAGELVFWR